MKVKKKQQGSMRDYSNPIGEVHKKAEARYIEVWADEGVDVPINGMKQGQLQRGEYAILAEISIQMDDMEREDIAEALEKTRDSAQEVKADAILITSVAMSPVFGPDNIRIISGDDDHTPIETEIEPGGYMGDAPLFRALAIKYTSAHFRIREE